MTRYEYKVVPAPAKGIKAKPAKTPEARFALGIETELNRLAAAGWEFQRAELLPCEERSGLTGTARHWRNLLVFRRALAEPVAGVPQADPAPAPAPEAEPPAPADTDDADLPAALRMRAAQQLTVVADADAEDRADKPHDHL
jgi:hypothetical protein